MTEERFNKAFNAFMLIGMTACVALSCMGRLQESDARKGLLLISAFGAVMGVASAVLSANGSIWTFLFGFMDVLIYSYILFDSRMPSQFLLYVLYFLPMEVVGFVKWRRRGATGSIKVKARRIKGIKWLWYALFFVAVFAVAFTLSWFIQGKAGSSDILKSCLDALITTGNIVALVMMAFAYMEQWYLWTMVNVFSIVIWAITMRQDPSAGYAVIPLIKYLFYLINGVNGIRIWTGLSREEF